MAGIEPPPRALREPGKFAQQGSGFSAFPGSECGAGLHQHPQTSGGSSSTLPCAKRKQAHKCLLSFGAGNGNRTHTSRFARAEEVRTARIWLQCISGKRLRSRTSPTPTNFRRVFIHIAMCQKKAGAGSACFLLEQVTGIEPAYPAWEAGVLPLDYTCVYIYSISNRTVCQPQK